MNNIKTQQFIELLKLNDYLLDYLEFNLFNHFKYFHPYDYLIDSMFELAELHRKYNSILDGIIIFSIESGYMDIEDINGDIFHISYDSVLEDLVRYFPELAIAIREQKINELIND